MVQGTGRVEELERLDLENAHCSRKGLLVESESKTLYSGVLQNAKQWTSSGRSSKERNVIVKHAWNMAFI